MGMIEPIQIDVNRCGGDDPLQLYPINMYGYAGMELTLGQLVNAICSHVGAALETQSISKMNLITRDASRLKGMSEVVEKLVSGEVTSYDTLMTTEGYTSTTMKDFLEKTLGYTIGAEGSLPATLDSYAKRLQVYRAMKEKLDAATTASQQDMIDLQTYISRRDVAFLTATNVVRTLGATKQITSGNCR